MFQKCVKALQYLLEIVFLQDSESAQKAVEELNGTEMFGKTLYVSRLKRILIFHLLGACSSS